MSNNLTLGQRLTKIIKQTGGAVTKDAAQMGLAQSALSDITHDRREIRSDTLKKICAYYGVSADYLLGLSDSKSPNLDTQSLHRATGLSEKALETLRTCKKCNDGSLNFINALLENEQAVYSLSVLMAEAINEKSNHGPGDRESYKCTLSYYIESAAVLESIAERKSKEVKENGEKKQ